MEKINKRNLDNNLLQYLRNVDSKITYDDLDPKIREDIKNMLPANEVDKYTRYNDTELRNRIQSLEDNKLNSSEAITEEDVAKKINELSVSLKSNIKNEMLNYVKNEKNSISEYLLSEDLKTKINSKYNSQIYYVTNLINGSSEGSSEPGSGSSGGNTSDVSNKIILLESKVATNTKNIKNNEDMLSTLRENHYSDMSLANQKIESLREEMVENNTLLSNDVQKNSSQLKTVSSQLNNNSQYIKSVETSLTNLSNSIDENYISFDDKIAFEQLEETLQEKLERVRYTNVKITFDDLEDNLADSIGYGENNKVTISDLDNELKNAINLSTSLSNGSYGQVGLIRSDNNNKTILSPEFIFENSMMVINSDIDDTDISEYQNICKEKEIYSICDISDGAIISYSENTNTWDTSEKTMFNTLSGKLFLLEPEKKLCFYDGHDNEYSCLIDPSVFVTNEAADEKYATILDLQSTNNKISDINQIRQQASQVSSLSQSVSQLTTTVSQSTTTISQLTTKVDQLTEIINRLENRIGQLEEEMAELQSK